MRRSDSSKVRTIITPIMVLYTVSLINYNTGQSANQLTRWISQERQLLVMGGAELLIPQEPDGQVSSFQSQSDSVTLRTLGNILHMA